MFKATITDPKESPFARVCQLHEAASSPPGRILQYAPADSLSLNTLGDGLRKQYDAPEAVHGFKLQAFRPSSLPLEMTAPLDETRPDLNELVPQMSKFHWDRNEDAESICSPKIARTDIPLTKFLPPRNVTSIRRSSMDACLQPSSYCDKFMLSARSASAPASTFRLNVADLWAQTTVKPANNPFDNFVDSDGLFKP